jgi:hypothetical protein
MYKLSIEIWRYIYLIRTDTNCMRQAVGQQMILMKTTVKFGASLNVWNF